MSESEYYKSVEVGPQGDDIFYATKFTGSITGTRHLIFRDLPNLVQEYSTGTLALDYGCGPGQSTLFMKSLELDVEGVDINEHMIKSAKENDPAGHYRVIQSGSIPRENNHYDLVCATGVLMHVSSKEELLKILQEIARVLKAGGTFITVVNSDDSFKYEWLSVSTQFEENKQLASGSPTKFFCKDTKTLYNLYNWTEVDYREAINKAGLTIVRVHKPFGTDSDGWEWINEKVKNFCTVFVAKK